MRAQLVQSFLDVDDPSTLPPADKLRWATLGFLARFRKATTRRGHETTLRQWFTFCEEHFVSPLNAKRPQIEIWARYLEDERGLMRSTVGHKLSTLAGFYKYALYDGLLDKDPMAHVERPQIPRESTREGLTRTELADLVRLAELSSPQDHALISVLGYNGLRISECLGIDIEAIGRRQGQPGVPVVRKGGKVQFVPFAFSTAWAVDKAIGDRTSGPLFVSGYGNRLDRKGADRVIQRLAKAADIGKRITPHSFRHGFVTMSRDAGVPDRDIQASTGHADARMIPYYDRGRDDLRRQATHTVAAWVERAL